MEKAKYKLFISFKGKSALHLPQKSLKGTNEGVIDKLHFTLTPYKKKIS